MSIAALKNLIEEDNRNYKKAKRKARKMKECPSCLSIRPRLQFKGKKVCGICHDAWENREWERQMGIRENILYVQFINRLAREEWKDEGNQ